jgi:O-acetylserine/cysteine efflux transporter
MQLPILLGILGANAIHNGLGGFLANMGTALAPATNAAFVMQCSTVTTTLIAWLLLGERLNRHKIATVAIIMLGSFLLLTDGLVALPGAGEVLLLLACISWSTGNVAVRGLLAKASIKPDVVSLLRPIAGLPVFITLLGISDFWGYNNPTVEGDIFDSAVTVYAALNGLLCALLWIFLNRTLEVASASYMTAMCSLTPVFVAILAVPCLGERLSLIQAGGAALIVCSSFIVHRLKF